MYSDILNDSVYYHQFIQMIGGKNIAWVAWGGGGSLVYDYVATNLQNSNENNVSITLVHPYLTGIEWRVSCVLNN